MNKIYFFIIFILIIFLFFSFTNSYIFIESLTNEYNTNIRFNSTGQEQTFTVPENVTEIRFIAQGGSGGGENGGKGTKIEGILNVIPGQTLYINSGGRGGTYSPDNNSSQEGGYNGGGRGGNASGGGGSTTITKRSGLLKDLKNNQSDILVVSAGGGGGGEDLPQILTFDKQNNPITQSDSLKGGNGGGPNGGNGIGKSTPSSPPIIIPGGSFITTTTSMPIPTTTTTSMPIPTTTTTSMPIPTTTTTSMPIPTTTTTSMPMPTTTTTSMPMPTTTTTSMPMPTTTTSVPMPTTTTSMPMPTTTTTSMPMPTTTTTVMPTTTTSTTTTALQPFPPRRCYNCKNYSNKELCKASQDSNTKAEVINQDSLNWDCNVFDKEPDIKICGRDQYGDFNYYYSPITNKKTDVVLCRSLSNTGSVYNLLTPPQNSNLVTIYVTKDTVINIWKLFEIQSVIWNGVLPPFSQSSTNTIKVTQGSVSGYISKINLPNESEINNNNIYEVTLFKVEGGSFSSGPINFGIEKSIIDNYKTNSEEMDLDDIDKYWPKAFYNENNNKLEDLLITNNQGTVIDV